VPTVLGKLLLVVLVRFTAIKLIISFFELDCIVDLLDFASSIDFVQGNLEIVRMVEKVVPLAF